MWEQGTCLDPDKVGRGVLELSIFDGPAKKRRSSAAVQDASRVRTVAVISLVKRRSYDGAHGVTRPTKVGL